MSKALEKLSTAALTALLKAMLDIEKEQQDDKAGSYQQFRIDQPSNYCGHGIQT